VHCYLFQAWYEHDPCQQTDQDGGNCTEEMKEDKQE